MKGATGAAGVRHPGAAGLQRARRVSAGGADRLLLNGAELVLASVSYAAKVKALVANPKVALTIDTAEPPWHILLVRGTAGVEIVDGVVPEWLAASRKGTPEDQWDAFEAEVRSLYKQMARIAVTPEWAKLIDFETTLPSAVERAVRERAASS